jgi:maleamate amidohydrolase
MSVSNYDEIRSYYQRKGLAGRVGFGQRPIVLVVDFYLGSTDPKSPLACDLEKPLAETLRILKSARRYELPIFFTRVEYSSDLHEAGLFLEKVPSLKVLVAGSRWVELDPRLGRRQEEMVITKHYASAFFETHLVAHLHSLNVDTVIITGCTTSGCVRASAVDALQNGFRAIVPEGAVGDRAEIPHAANLFDIDAKYGDVVSVDAVLAYFEGFGGDVAQNAKVQHKKVPGGI